MDNLPLRRVFPYVSFLDNPAYVSYDRAIELFLSKNEYQISLGDNLSA